MALYLLDTSFFSRLMREEQAAIDRMQSLSSEDRVVVCTIVRGEIEYGLVRLEEGKRRRLLEEKAANIFSSIPCEAVPEAAAGHYGRIKRGAERAGAPVDENDLWIAATARALGAVLVTADSDFARIEGLAVENWGD